jgi:serine/threonine protein kinase
MTTTPVPSKIGKYDVVGVIGRGGMGVVYQAMDPHLDRKVAIKMITGQFSENPDMLKRFFREAQSLGSLQHPNIVTVFDLGDFGGNPYFVMEFLEGEGLDSLLAKPGQLNLLEKIGILIQVCNGLGYAHRRGVVHRDIKPANIMISRDGGVKIFDFGIAHAGQSNVTQTGEVIGTLRYMAPEQVNSKGIDSRTDIFSTGVVLYQLMTDHLPFDGENTASTLMKIVSAPPPPLGNFLSAYPPEMEEILLKALAKNPNERYSTAEDFALDLAQLQGQLKEELIGREMEEVAALIDRGEIYTAQGTLLRVLKIDQQHTRASRLLREVQQRIQRDELSTQVRGVRERGAEALADEQCETAVRAEKLHKTLHEQRPIGPGEGLTNKVRQILRDTTLFGKAPPADDNAADIAPAVASDELQEAYLPIIERHLAAFVGPLAKVHVKRAATKTTSVLELYTMLSANLQKEEDRKAFLARRAELAGGRGSAAFTKLATPAVSPSSPPPADLALPSEITAAAVEQIAKRLAAHLGPIAPVLARREAKRASSLQEFYELLAEHIVNPVDRQRFLKEAGIGKEPPPSLTARRSL